MWRAEVEGPAVAVRARAKFNLPVNVVLGLISNRSIKGKWDESFNSVIKIEEINGRWCSIVNERFNGIWPAAGRDFCLL